MLLLCQRDSIPCTHPQHHRHQTTTTEDSNYQQHAPIKTAKQVHTFLGLVRYYRKFIKDFAKMAKSLTLLTCHKAKFEWTPTNHTVFMMLKEAIVQAPILCYPDPARRNIVYMMHWMMHVEQTFTGTWWNQIPNSILISHLHWNTKEVEHPRTGSLQSILCYYQMELLPSRIWYHSPQWS